MSFFNNGINCTLYDRGVDMSINDDPLRLFMQNFHAFPLQQTKNELMTLFFGWWFSRVSTDRLSLFCGCGPFKAVLYMNDYQRREKK